MNDGPILICYDDSTGARRAIEEAAKLLGPRRAVVLAVGPILTTAESVAAISSVVPGDAFEDLNTADARQRATAGAEHAREAGFDAEPKVELAEPVWQGIVAVASEIGAAAIVLGSRGLNGLREAVSGSVSHQVAAHASCPVVIMPAAHNKSK
jgi:nucleotide-binding universal stress UspA family protein